MTEKPQKPITLVKAEFTESLVNLINNSSLPPFITESVLKDIYEQVKITADYTYQQEKLQYEESLKQNTSKEKSNNE